MSFRTTIIGFCLLAVSAAGIYLGLAHKRPVGPRYLTLDPELTVIPDPPALKSFTLRDADGRALGLERLRGRWTMLFFGYTSCPDVCPDTLAILHQVHQAQAAQKISRPWQTIFVSVDPDRDRNARLKRYVHAFDRDFIGASGTRAQIDDIVRQFGAHYTITRRGGKESVTHSAAVYLVDPEARFQALLTPPFRAASLLSRLELVRRMQPK